MTRGARFVGPWWSATQKTYDTCQRRYIMRMMMSDTTGRGSHSSTSQLNLSRFRHKMHPKHLMIPPDDPQHHLANP